VTEFDRRDPDQVVAREAVRAFVREWNHGRPGAGFVLPVCRTPGAVGSSASPPFDGFALLQRVDRSAHAGAPGARSGTCRSSDRPYPCTDNVNDLSHNDLCCHRQPSCRWHESGPARKSFLDHHSISSVRAFACRRGRRRASMRRRPPVSACSACPPATHSTPLGGARDCSPRHDRTASPSGRTRPLGDEGRDACAAHRRVSPR
jgi:hypothetical protein